MKATAILMQEHELVLSGLKVLEALSARVADGAQIPREDALATIDFFAVFVDRSHHAKEEGVLFPALGVAGLPDSQGPVAVMLHEHAEGREYIEELRRAVEAEPSSDARASFVKAARGYSALLSQHIQKENRVLFPLADRLIAGEDREIVARFVGLEDEAIGNDGYARYAGWLDEISKRYTLGDIPLATGTGCCCAGN